MSWVRHVGVHGFCANGAAPATQVCVLQARSSGHVHQFPIHGARVAAGSMHQ